MKKLLFLIFIVCAANSTQAQEPELLETNWYIDYLILDDVTYNNPIVNAIGILDPNMVFDVDVAYAAMHPESDSFFANVSYDPVDPAFTFANMGITLPGCQAYCEFAGKYFELLIGDFVETNFTYEIIVNSDDSLSLTITRTDGNFAVYQDSRILGTEDTALSKVRLFPNPTTDILFISELDNIQHLVAYDRIGRKLLEIVPEGNSIDVSSLPQGLYFLEIISHTQKEIFNFIKK